MTLNQSKMKNMTAVEWLYETLWKQNNYSLPNNILDQAKEMEKEQICHAVNQHYVIPENYYYKTYGGNK